MRKEEMNLNINLEDISMSDIEILEILEHSLHLDYNHSCVQNGDVYHLTSNPYDGFAGNKTDIPEEVYSAYVTIRKYLLKENKNE